MNRIIQLPETVSEIIRQLGAAGHDAYAVGGCIRDSLMGKQPADWDICTSALPEETLKILGKQNIVENGMKHGTVTVRFDHRNYEITTFRTDGEYEDNRHPKEVTFVRNLAQDLARRDFTVNALAYNDSKGLVDLYNGIEDLRQQRICCVGDPDKRFHEDALRILRALRFSSQLGFTIDPATAESIHRNARLLTNISAERIMAEFQKILTGRRVEELLMEYPDVIGVFVPEVTPMLGFRQRNPHHSYDVWEHTVKVVANSEPDPLLRLTAFLHDIGKPRCFTIDEKNIGHFHGHPDVGALMAHDILKRLKSDNRTLQTVCLLIKLHDRRPPADSKNVRRLVAKTGTKLFPLLLSLKRADAKGQNPLMITQKLEYIDRLEGIFHAELANHAVFSLKQMALNGYDLQCLGIHEGKRIGILLNELLALVIEGELPNDRDRLLQEAKKLNERF